MKILAEEKYAHIVCREWTLRAGLVSTSEDQRENLSMITVFNSLTGQWRRLLPDVLSKVQPLMVQLVMDENNKFCKVIVVGEKRRVGRETRRLQRF